MPLKMEIGRELVFPIHTARVVFLTKYSKERMRTRRGIVCFSFYLKNSFFSCFSQSSLY